MKFKAHESFFIRKGWLYKGMSNIIKDPGVFQGTSGNPMDVLGIGSNMVKSLRYWLIAAGLSSEPKTGKKNQTLTELGRTIYDNDRYMEEIGSIWLVHYILSCNEEEATSWYIFFNEFNKSEFNADDFHNAVVKYVRMQGEASLPSDRVIDDDFSCITNTYVPRAKLNPAKTNPESNIECPLGELGLVDVIDKKKGIYKKTTPKADSIPLLILLSVVINNADGKQIKISSLQNNKGNIGKVFNLDTITLINLLYKLETMGYIKVVRTAGLDYINIVTEMTFLECVKTYYSELNN